MAKPVKYFEIARQIESQILSKTLLHGAKLPSIRELAIKYSVAKNTVISALQQLESKKLVVAAPKKGYFVSYQSTTKRIPKLLISPLTVQAVNMPDVFYDVMEKGAAFDILATPTNFHDHNKLSELNRYIGKSLRQKSAAHANYYDKPLGNDYLREQIALRYQQRECNFNREQLCITSGCQHALFIALLSCCKPGDNIAVETPTFYGVLRLLEQLNLNIIEIPSSIETGINTKELTNALSKWNISACIVTPCFATPAGSCMTDTQKQSMVLLANEYDFAIIEDDIYGDIGFDQSAIKPIKAFDTEDRVILCGSFSKSLSRDLRLGWISAGRWHKEAVRFKLASQLANSQSDQEGVAQFMMHGHYRRHLDQFRVKLAQQQAQLIDAIEQYFPKDCAYSIPKGGLCLWLELNNNVNTDVLYQQARKLNIHLTPGLLFSSQGFYNHHLRLSYNHPITNERLTALKQLAMLIKKFN